MGRIACSITIGITVIPSALLFERGGFMALTIVNIALYIAVMAVFFINGMFACTAPAPEAELSEEEKLMREFAGEFKFT